MEWIPAFAGMDPVLPALVFGAVDDIDLLFGGQVGEIDRKAGHTDHQVAVLFRFFHGFAQNFAGDDIELNLINAFGFDCPDERYQVVDIPFAGDKLGAEPEIKRAAEGKPLRG